MNNVVVRRFNLETDSDAVSRLDVSFTSDRVAHVESSDKGISLVWVESEKLIEKCFPLQLDADSWHAGWVIEEERLIRGFLAVGHNPWNKRLVIWHFYVDRAHRRRGFGRLLLEPTFSEAKSLGATTAWLETTNVNYPGVIAYQRLGFDLCGFDLTLYKSTPSSGEFGLFLARNL